MDAPDPETITLTLHQVQRLVEGFYGLDDCRSIRDVQKRVASLAETCPCQECEGDE